MIRDEVIELLSYVQAFDRRNVGDAEIEAWHSLLIDLDPADVASVVREHFRSSTDWLMPAHVVRGVRELRAARLRRYGSLVPGEVWPELPLDGDPDLELRKVRELGELVASGRVSRDRQGRPELTA